MALKYLGNTLDIHGGGQDLIFPHHENEIAQSESFTATKPFARYWLHNGLVQLGEEKMSKSLGNLITIKEALGKYSPDAIRIFVLSSHYRSPLTYSEETLGAAERGAERLWRVMYRNDTNTSSAQSLDAEPYRQQFIEAMDDDFNTPQALASLFYLARAINQAADSGISFLNARSVLAELACKVLGLKLHLISPELATIGAETAGPTIATGPAGMPPEVILRVGRLVVERYYWRQAKNYQRADEIRDELAKLGVTLEDTKVRTNEIFKRVPSVKSLDNLMEKLGIALEDTP